MLIVRLVQRKREWAGQSGKKRKFIRGKREGEWLLRRTSILPFWWSPSYTPPMRNSRRVWNLVVSYLWEDRCQWDKRMSFGQFGQSHRSLWFILCLRGGHNELSYQWDPMWTLSFQPFWFRIRAEGQSSVTVSYGVGAWGGQGVVGKIRKGWNADQGFVWGQSFW